MIETRYMDAEDIGPDLDEVFATGAGVHLERMDTNEYALIIEDADERICIRIATPRATIRASESWREPARDESVESL